MKIIDVAEHYAPLGGGVKTYINNKIKYAEKLGHEMIVIAPSDKNEVEVRGTAKIYWVKGPRLVFDKRYGVFKNRKLVEDILNDENPDIVEGGSLQTGGKIVSNWKGRAAKVLVFHQDFIAAYAHTFFDKVVSRKNIDTLFKPYWKNISKLSKGYDATVVAGDWLADRLLNQNIKNPVSIPFGIDKEFFSPQKFNIDQRDKMLKLCKRPDGTPLFITVSRFHPEKRLRTLFKAVRIVNEKRPVAHIVYGDGLLAPWDRKYAKNTPGVCLAGFTKDRNEIAEAYASSDLLLHGSAAETFGLSVAEAICSGLPVVGPSVGGAADLIGDDNGLIYDAGNAESCANAILKCLDTPREIWRERLSRNVNSIKTVEEHFINLFDFYASLAF